MYYELYLPFPPSINNYYKKSQHGGKYISEKGQWFRDETQKIVLETLPGVHITDRMLVEIIMFPPDARLRDVDNYNKALLDAVTCSKLWQDDKLIDQLFNYRGEVRQRNGSVYMRITDAGPVITSPDQLPVE